MGLLAQGPALAAARAASRFNVNAIVAQAIQALKQSQSQTIPPPPTMPRDLLATVEILGQGPGLRRPLGAAGNAVFGAWAQAAAAAERVTILRGNGQVALLGTKVRVAPAIAITDGFGRPSQGVPVVFVVTPGGGSIVDGSPSTGQDGVASLKEWTLGTTPGLNRLQVFVRGGAAAVANFDAFAIPTRRCEILHGDGQSEPAGTALPIDPEVRVVDALTGQPLDGLNVAFAVTPGDGTIANATAVTDPDGIATPGAWKLGMTPNVTNTLVATVGGADAVVFTALAT